MTDFATIPVDFHLPGAFGVFDSSRSQRGLSGLQHRILLVGYKLAAGSAPEGAIVKLAPDSGADLFGRGSVLALMAESALTVNKWQEFYAIALPESNSAKPAKSKITVSGKASRAGTSELVIPGGRLRVSIDKDDTSTIIAEKIHNQIPDALPITSSFKSGESVVTLSFQNKGSFANGVLVYSEGDTPAGVSLKLEKFSGGAGGADAEKLISALGDNWWTEIALFEADTVFLTKLNAELEKRDGGTIQKTGYCFVASHNTNDEASTLAQKLNSRYISVLGLGENATPNCVAAAIYASVAARESSRAPGRPLQYVNLPGIDGGPPTSRLNDAARNTLVKSGVATARWTSAGMLQLERAVTTYLKNSSQVSDTSWRDIEDVCNLRFLRWSLNNRLLHYYPRARIGVDNDPPRSGVVRPRDIRATLTALAQEWLNAGLISDLPDFSETLEVTRDNGNPDRLLIQISPKLIGQLRQFVASIQFKL